MARSASSGRRRFRIGWTLAGLWALGSGLWALGAPPPNPASTSPAATATVDLHAEFQQIEAEAKALDPASPEAVARLRGMIERLARANAQLARELAQVRLLAETRPAPVVGVAPRPAAGRPLPANRSSASAGPPVTSVSKSQEPRAKSQEPGAPLFAKRGLRKFHRIGCAFGERIRVEERVGYSSAAAAVAAGLEPCKVCRPE